MASVQLRAPNGTIVNVSSLLTFEDLVFGNGYAPVTGTIVDNRTTLETAAPLVASAAEVVRLGDLQDSTSDASTALKAAYATVPTVVDQGLFVAPGGDDANNNGLSPGTALATLDAALAKLPTGSGSRGRVSILPGTYTLSAGISRVVDNVEIVGLGNSGQSSTLGGGPGAVTLIVPDGAVGLTLGDGSNRFRGPILRNLHIKANSSAALGGIHLKGYSNWLMERVVCSGFTAGYGFFFDGGAGLTMYGEMVGCVAADCQTGLDNLGGSGVTLFGGTFDNGDNNAGVVVAGSTGIRVRGANGQVFAFGTRIQSFDTCADLQSGGGRASHLVGIRCEGFNLGVQTNAPGTVVHGGEFNNTQWATSNSVGNIGTAFKTLASSSAWRWMPADVASIATETVLDPTSPGVLINGQGSYSSGFGALNARLQVNSRGATVIAGLFQAFTGQTADIMQYRNSNGTPKSGVLAGGTLYSDDAAQGVLLKDQNGHYWRATVSTTGVLTTADLGTTKPTA